MKKKSVFKYSDFAIFLLLCLIVFTLSQAFNTTSKYKSEANASSSAKVAKWDVSITPVTQTNSFNMVAGNTAPIEYTVRVNSNSEVSSIYSIVVSNIPNNVKVSLDGGLEQIPTNNTVTFQNAGMLNVGSTNTYNDHRLVFDAPIEASAVSNNSINIQVEFIQKD